MPYTASTVPDNVPKKYAAQFAEVWNSVYKAAKADKKSDADAEATAFTQAHGVINAAKKKDDRDVSSDGPGFGPTRTEDGGQASDPQQLLRYSEDQPRDEHGKFGSGSHTAAAESHEAKAKEHEDKARKAKDAGHTKESDTNWHAAEAHHNAAEVHQAAIGGSAQENKMASEYSKIAEHASNVAEAAKGMRHLSHLHDTRENYMSIERRYVKELRVGNSQGDEMALVGYAARFNQPSKDLGGFRETIAPGAFARALASSPDVRCLFNHDANRVLGRTTAGTLSISEDNSGLKFRCMLDPNNSEHRNLYSSVKRGDINECSFAFTPNGPEGDHWEDRKDDVGNWYIQRTLKDVNLFDVSAVTHPAYSGTNVDARQENITPEIRSIMSKMVEKRAKAGIEKRDEGDSIEEYICEVSKALAAKFPHVAEESDIAYSSSYGQYWICETYEDCVIASDENTGEYFKIPYVENPDGDSYVFGQPQPVEKEWVPSERSKSIMGEMRAAKDAHMQQIADMHKAEAASHTGTADAHSQAAAAHQAAADATEAAIEAKRQYRKDNGLMDEEDWEDNIMCERSKVYGYADEGTAEGTDDSDYEDGEGDDESTRAAKKVHREQRAAGMVRTKTVDGKSLPKSAFAFVGDPNDTSTWKLPVHDKSHADNAAARLNQTNGIPEEKKASVESKIKSAQKKFGEKPAADDAARAFKEDMELRFRISLLSTEVQ